MSRCYLKFRRIQSRRFNSRLAVTTELQPQIISGNEQNIGPLQISRRSHRAAMCEQSRHQQKRECERLFHQGTFWKENLNAKRLLYSSSISAEM